ncbi:MAG: EVE domain-containing protein [Candidatus Paceibacterota bacterium]
MTQKRNYWLLKSEPSTYSLTDLKNEGETPWTGVRNYQARNFMRDSMKPDDSILFYHSNTSFPGIVGVGEVRTLGYPDQTQFDPDSEYFDPRATKKQPRWFCVMVGFIQTFSQPVLLKSLKSSTTFSDMTLTQKGSRLSVQPVSAEHFKAILKLGREEVKKVS